MLTVCLASSQEASDFYAETRAGSAVRSVVTGFSNRLLKQTFRLGAFGDFLITGYAGATSPALEPGSVFLPRRVLAEGRAPLYPDAFLQDSLIDALMAEEIAFTEGALLTTREPVASMQQRDFVRGTGADAADLETYELLEYFSRLGRRAAVLRLVSDRADEQAAWDYRENLGELSDRLSGVLRRAARRLEGMDLFRRSENF